MLILHLSDIHFRGTEIDTAQDPNFHLRNELVRDVRRQCELLGRPDAIVVSGDVAYGGSPDEFAYATRWLATLCDACRGSLQTVFVVPGNHDVVRESAERNLVQLIHREIKAASDPSDVIARQMRDPDVRRLLYESLDNYNAFALQFFCDLLPPERTRATRDLTLNDGSTFAFVGPKYGVRFQSARRAGQPICRPRESADHSRGWGGELRRGSSPPLLARTT